MSFIKYQTQLLQEELSKNENSNSDWHLKGSKFGPILFNVFLFDIFFLIDEIDIASYANNNTPYTRGHTPYIMNKLETACKKLFKWFSDIEMQSM